MCFVMLVPHEPAEFPASLPTDSSVPVEDLSSASPSSFPDMEKEENVELDHVHQEIELSTYGERSCSRFLRSHGNVDPVIPKDDGCFELHGMLKACSYVVYTLQQQAIHENKSPMHKGISTVCDISATSFLMQSRNAFTKISRIWWQAQNNCVMNVAVVHRG